MINNWDNSDGSIWIDCIRTGEEKRVSDWNDRP